MLEKLKKGIVAAVAVATAATVGGLGLASTANALTATDKGSITVSNLADDNDKVDVTATAYRIIDVNYDYTADQPKSPEFTWDKSVASWVRTNFPKYIGDGDTVTDTYEGLASDEGATTSGIGKDNQVNEGIAKFFDKLGASNLLTTAAGTATSTGSSVTINGLDLGGYYVRITNNGSAGTGLYVYRSAGANVLPEYDKTAKQWKVADATIVAKRSKPSMDKSINETRTGDINTGVDKKDQGSDTASIGDKVDFDLRTDVPVYPENATNKKYWISDAMDKGLTFNNDVTVYGVKDGQETQLAENTDYTKTLNDKDMDGHDATFVLQFTYERIRSYSKIHVKYTATVNENAVVGKDIDNHAKLQYSNNPYSGESHHTEGDETKVYVFGIKVNKIKAGTTTPLPGAEFKLTTKGSTDAIEFVKTGEGVYRKATAKDTTTTTTLKVDAGGHLDVYGLKGTDEAGNPLTYQLTETKAPAGYNLLSEPVDVTLTPSKDASKDYTGHLEGETETGYVTRNVENTTGRLPKTGGIGTIVFSVLGALMIAGGVALLASRRKA